MNKYYNFLYDFMNEKSQCVENYTEEELKDVCSDDVLDEIKTLREVDSSQYKVKNRHCSSEIEVYETQSYWLVNSKLGLGYGQYYKETTTLQEAIDDQTLEETGEYVNNLSELKYYHLVATFNADPFAVETDEELKGVIKSLEKGYCIYDKEDDEFEGLSKLLDGDVETYEYIYSNDEVIVGFLK